MAVNASSTRADLERHLGRVLNSANVTISTVEKLGGGAIQENWELRLSVATGPHAGEHRWVLRTDSPSTIKASHSRAQEFAILEVAHAAGVRVPQPVHHCVDEQVLGRAFYIMSWEPGEARGHKLVRDPEIIEAGDRIVAELGEQVARLHRIEPPGSGLDFISVPTFNPALARIEELQRYLGEQAEPQPVLEMALRWLGTNLPETDRVCLVHGDLRTGNFLVHEGRLSAVLDFEFAAFSDPLEDLGWMLARCWRFGQYDKVAGGIGSAEAFLDAYEQTADRSLDRRSLPYWQVMATVRWAVIALEQAARAYVQKENSLELALTGEVVPSLEWDILDFIDRIERRDIGPGWLR